jgi:hypothetical protein
MEGVLEVVMCSRAEDADRFAAIVHAAIVEGRAKALKPFTRLYGRTAEEGAAPKLAAARAKADGERLKTSAAEAAEADAFLAEARAEFRTAMSARKAAGAAGALVPHAGTSSGGPGAGAGAVAGAGFSSSSSSASARSASSTALASRGADDLEPSLADLIRFKGQQRGAAFGGMLDSLEAKYAGKGAGKGTGAAKGRGTASGARSDSGKEKGAEAGAVAGAPPASKRRRGGDE